MHECLKTPLGAKRTLCPLDSLLPRLGDKWTIHIMALLSEAKGNQLRFSQLKNNIEGISQKMLTVTLRELERDGLVIRHVVFPEVPPRVEYHLTRIGKEMLPSLTSFMDWMQNNWAAIETARAEYDRQRA